MPDYSFFQDYLSKVNDDAEKVDPTEEIDDNDFYDTKSEEPEINEDIDYSITPDEQSSDDDVNHNQDDLFSDEEQQNPDDDNMLDNLLGDNDPYSQGTMGDNEDDDASEDNSEGGETTPVAGTLGSKISNNESQGKYSAFNPNGGGAGAVGKYQFRWNIWKDSIEKVTGVKSESEFQKSPKAQEKYYAWYEKNYLKPAANRLKPFNKANLSDDQLAQLVHFRGEGGAKKYLLGQAKDKPESYNMSTSKYIATRQIGGNVGVASTPSAQYTGLNDASFTNMIFPMKGENTFRGLDSGDPVYLEDETGKKKILKGKKDTTKMKGKVFEKRLK